jgi:hypothetical protein
MRSRQCLLEICGTFVDENFGVWKTVARPRPPSLLHIAFGDGWTLAIPDAEL